MLATVSEDKVRLDVFAASAFNISRSAAKNVIEKDGALVDGVRCFKSGATLKQGSVIEMQIPAAEQLDVSAADIPLDIVYEDEYMAVVNKPQGMIVHQSGSHKAGDTLVNALLYRLNSLSGINGVIRPGIVHRLDKDTSGLLVVAKNDEAHRSLASQIERKTAHRIYVGLCDGNFKQDEGTVDAPLARSKTDRKKIAIVEGGRCAVTHYKVLERFQKFTLVRFELETGRTHQIRVHAASLRHPIVGDSVYGGSTSLYCGGQLLHAARLELKHPHTGEDMAFEAPLPDYFEAVLAKLRKK